MKKLLLLALIALCIGIIIPQKLYAVDITVGATTWYAWWDIDAGQESLDVDPTFLYGPALSVKFNNDFNLTFIYLYGKYDVTFDKGKDTVKRTDSDIALNYRLNDYFKLFAGMKYMGFEQDYKQNAIGPGLGLSATVPVMENFFLLGTLSGFHLWGKGKHGENNGTISSNYKEYGFNSTLSLAYYIAPASTTVSLGGRYQYFKTNDDSSNGNNFTSKIYGATLTATYTFSI